MRLFRVMSIGVAALFAGMAQAASIEDFAGESWFGLYMNGNKVGYAQSVIEVNEDGSVRVMQDLTFRLSMVGMQQEMQSVTERTYRADGSLATVESAVDDPSGTTSRFLAKADARSLELRQIVGGQESVVSLRPPRESLDDWIRASEVIESGAAVGQTFESYVFEPMFGQEMHVQSEVAGVEERIFDGVATKVFKVNSIIQPMGLTSTAFIAETGELLEDQVANGLITMRLEPEAVAKNADYSNDTIVSNAAMVDQAISNPRTRDELILRIQGPLDESHWINDAGQQFERMDGGYRFVGRRATLDGPAATLPITEPSVAQWLEPTTFVQSRHPQLVAKAQEIVGEETDALKAAEKIVEWVSDNMRATFSARLTNSLEVLNSLEGDCTEHSMLFVGLARAAGLPAREAAGLIYAQLPEPGFYFHQWAKVWVGEWIDVDPTFDQLYADATHIKLSEGDLIEQMSLLPVIGQIQVEVESD